MSIQEKIHLKAVAISRTSNKRWHIPCTDWIERVFNEHQLISLMSDNIINKKATWKK